MGTFETIQIISFVFVILSFAFLVWSHFTSRQSVAVNAETYTTILHKSIKSCIGASKIGDPFHALLLVAEARACIETLSKICGGDVCLSDITGTNITQILNTINYQETLIRSHLAKDPHPLASEIINEQKN